MAINKVEINNADGTKNTLIDLTEDTVTANMLAEGEVAHSASGERIVGLLPIGEIADLEELLDYLNSDMGEGVTQKTVIEMLRDFAINYASGAEGQYLQRTPDGARWATMPSSPTEGSMVTDEHINALIDAKTDGHSHSNKGVLDGITSEDIESWSTFTNTYKTRLDTLTDDYIRSLIPVYNGGIE